MATADGSFSLAGQSLKLDTAADIEAHIGPLQAGTQFKSIALNGNTIGVAAAEALASRLAEQKTLESINLADVFTGRLLAEIPPALDALLTALRACPALHTVDLSDNAFGLNTVAPLVSFLRAHAPLQHLLLNNNGLGPIAGTAVAEALTELAAVKKTAQAPPLVTVVCGRNRLEAGSMAAWAAAFGALPGMQTVRMVQNGIRQEGIITLLRDGLSRCAALRVLDLQDNTFTASGSAALARALPHWPHLEELGVGDCLLGARGFVRVAEALAVPPAGAALKTLRAQYDEVDARGVAALARAAADALPALQRVELNGNKFVEDDPGVAQLQEVLQGRRSKAGAESDDEAWGLDELSDLEEESDAEDNEEDELEEEEEAAAAAGEPAAAADAAAKLDRLQARDEEAGKRDKIVEEARLSEAQEVAQDKDADVDALADQLGKTL